MRSKNVGRSSQKKMDAKWLYLTLIASLVVVGLVVFTYAKATYFGGTYQKALTSENPNNICATPSGYTNEQWREHMSHHPDRYKDCL